MYIIINALRSITRSLARNILIGIIVLIIAASACIGLSIRRAAQQAEETGLDSMTVTAQISMDIGAMMESARGEDGKFDRESFSGGFDAMQTVELAELQAYAAADSSSAWLSPERSRTIPISCLRMNRQATSTERPRRRSWTSSARLLTAENASSS